MATVSEAHAAPGRLHRAFSVFAFNAEGGLIHPLGQFVLKKACADLKAVPDLKSIILTVN